MVVVCDCTASSPSLLATFLESEVNVVFAFNGTSRLLEDYCPSVSKYLQEFDATYLIDWDCVRKGLLRGNVQLFQTFVVGIRGQDGNDAKDQSSNDEVELGDGKAKSPLVPFNSTVCPRNGPKRRQKAPKSGQYAPNTPKRSMGCILG